MQTHFQIFLAVPADCRQRAAAFGLPLAHMIYALSEKRLYRTHPQWPQGGIMAVDCASEFAARPEALVSDALRECSARSLSGIFLDRDTPAGELLADACAALERACNAAGIALYVSPALAPCTRTAPILTSTTVSGGSLKRRLSETVGRYGRNRLALDLELARTDFVLPQTSGGGTALSAAALQALMRRLRPRVFYSGDLCANYFTYRERDKTHFVLFDNAQTLHQKLTLGQQLGARCAFLFYPEVEPLLPQLLA